MEKVTAVATMVLVSVFYKALYLATRVAIRLRLKRIPDEDDE
jgi:hypothetical protein